MLLRVENHVGGGGRIFRPYLKILGMFKARIRSREKGPSARNYFNALFLDSSFVLQRRAREKFLPQTRNIQ